MHKEPEKTDYTESDPDFYLKKFMPVWKQYRLFLTIYTAVVIFFLIIYGLFPYFNLTPDKAYMDYIFYGLLTLIAIGAIISLYFYDKLRCPKCNSLTITGLFTMITGKCPSCHVQLKNRLASYDTARIVNASMIGIYVVVTLVVLYLVFNK